MSDEIECPRCMVRQGSWYSASSRVASDSPSPSSSFRDDGILLARKCTVPFVFVSAQPYRTSSLDDIRTGRGISRHQYSRRSQYSEYGSRQGSTRRKGSVHSEGRRSSVRSNRSRRNSCALERNKATARTRKASTPIVPSASVSASASASATALPTKPYVLADLPYEDEDRARRHRIAVWLVLGSFIFIAFSSILIVVVTLTHQSELSFDENNTFKYYTFAVPSKLKPYIDSVRKENEELMNSLNRDSSGYNVSSVQASLP